MSTTTALTSSGAPGDRHSSATGHHQGRSPSHAGGSGSDSTATGLHRPSWARLVTIEVRKSVDTRAGWALLAGTFALALIGVGWKLTHLPGQPASYEDWLGSASTGVVLLIPVFGVMAMTSEWSQRTVLTTFTLSPRRGRVFSAKLAAAVVLELGLTLGLMGVATVGVLLGSSIDGHGIHWGHSGTLIGGLLAASTVNVLLGVAIGALAGSTPIAITALFVAPSAWQIIAGHVLHDQAKWLDIYKTIGHVSEIDLRGHIASDLTAVIAWIVLPTALGARRALRRDVS